MWIIILLGLVFFLGVPFALAALFGHVRELRSRTRDLENEMLILRHKLSAQEAGTPEPIQPALASRLLEVAHERQACEPSAPIPVFAPIPNPPPVLPPRLPPLVEPAASAEPESSGGWEQFFGVKLFAWVGGLALFMGVAFFLKYSFERDLIPPAARVLLGLVFGAGLIIAGDFVRRRDYAVTAQTLVATGLVVLNAVCFAARALYQLIGTGTLFAALTGLTAAAFFLAIRFNAQVVAILGVLGGFLTPHLVGGHNPNPYVLFGYVLFLNIGLMIIGRKQGWPILVRLGVGATIVTEVIWTIGALNHSTVLGTVIMLALLNALFVFAHYWDGRQTDEADQSELITIAHALVTYVLMIPVIGMPAVPAPLIAFGIFAPNLALLALSSRRTLLIGAAGSFILIGYWILARGAAETPVLNVCLIHAFLNTGLPHWFSRADEQSFEDRAFRSLPAVLPFLALTLLFSRRTLSPPDLEFAYLAAIAAFTVLVAIRFQNSLLHVIALGGVLLAEYSWFSVWQNTETLPQAGPWFLLTFLFFTLAPFTARRFLAAGDLLPWRVSAAAGPLHFWLLYQVARAKLPAFEWPGLIPVVLAIPSVAALIFLRRQTSSEEQMRFSAIYGASVLFFVTVIFPVQFERQWLTIGWALEGAAFFWLYRRFPVDWLPKAATALLAVAFVRLALNPQIFGYQPRSGFPILNWYLYTYGIVAAALAVAAKLAGTQKIGTASLRSCFSGGAVVLLFILMNIEIADFFSTGAFTTFEFSGNFARDMTYSLAWALFALALLGTGAIRDLRPVRIAGIGLMVLTLIKLFIHDLSQLDHLYRIGAFIGVAVILIFASWLYQRFLSHAKRAPQG